MTKHAKTAKAEKSSAAPKSNTIRLCESLPTAIKVDRENGVIRGVKILGLESANGRSYSREAVSKAKGLYEGRSVNVNHANKLKPGEDRRLEDRFGRLTNVREESSGLYGDLEYIKSHSMAESVIEAAERMPEQLGLSHCAEGRLAKRNGKNLVEEITSVRSVDLVSDPATTRSLFESETYMDPLNTMPGGDLAPVDSPATDPAEALKAGVIAAITAALSAATSDQIKAVLAALDMSDSASDIASGTTSAADDPAADSADPSKEKPVDESKKKAPAAPSIAELQEANRLLLAENESIKLLESAGVPSDAAKLKALVALGTTADRQALVATWPKSVASASSIFGAGATRPRSTLLESRDARSEVTAPKDAKGFAALVR